MRVKTNRLCVGLTITLVIVTILMIIFVILYAISSTRVVQPSVPETPEWKRTFISESGKDIYQYNAITSDSAVCSTIGDYILNAIGGNAIDAMVASLLCVGVSNFHSAGIGGGSFLVYYNRSSQTTVGYDFRETAPQFASRDMFNSLPRNASLYGGLAVAVPGEVSGLYLVHKRYGQLPWRTVVSPVVTLLQTGQRVGRPLARAIASWYDRLPSEPPFKELKDWMVNPDTARPYAAGEVLKDLKLAATMQKIAEDPFTFYNGSLADEIVKEVRAAGGNMTKEDLLAYQPREVAPLAVKLRNGNLRLHSLPPPSSGAVLSFILNIIDGYSMQPSLKDNFDHYVTFLHRAVEAFKFGYARRSALGDAKFVDVKELLVNLTSDAYADEIRAKISDLTTQPVNFYGPNFDWQEDSGTTHVSIIDSDGNALAVTSTINTYFGSLVRGSTTGIVYNNEMDDFSVPNRTNYFGVPPSPSNFIAPNKKPMSSMAPVIVTDAAGDVKFVSGASGGTRITTAIAYNLARQIFLNETVKEAADAMRLHHQLVPNHIQYNPSDSPIPSEIMAALKAKGHEFATTTSFSVVEGIHRLPNKLLQANADFRKPSKTGGF